MRTVDVNADIGEGLDDTALMAHLTSVSIACGGHAGDRETMLTAARGAAGHGLRIGAHPSYPDRLRFGRAAVKMGTAELGEALVAQVQSLRRLLASLDLELTHVKPHGALYNRAWDDPEIAGVVVAATLDVSPGLRLMCPAGSELEKAGLLRGLRPLREVFADRAYGADSRLLPRDSPGAIVAEPAQLDLQVEKLASLEFETMCVHGDNPAAPGLLEALPEALRRHDILAEAYAV